MLERRKNFPYNIYLKHLNPNPSHRSPSPPINDTWSSENGKRKTTLSKSHNRFSLLPTMSTPDTQSNSAVKLKSNPIGLSLIGSSSMKISFTGPKLTRTTPAPLNKRTSQYLFPTSNWHQSSYPKSPCLKTIQMPSNNLASV